MQTLRIVPDLRSSVVEEMPPGQLLLHTSRRTDADADLVAGPGVRPFTWSALVRALDDPDLVLLEVAEPLWLAEWGKALRYVVLARVLRALRPGRGGILVATYAIENLDARERLRVLAHRPVLGAAATAVRVAAMGASLRLLDAVVFGTTGAHENYRRTFGRSLRRVRHTVLTPRTGACTVCGPREEGGGGPPREPVALFLGAPSERKGFGVLMRAWELADAAGRGWRLVVADPDGGDGRALPEGVAVTSPSRRGVHELLRTSAVVVMPSVRRPGWREQIGLPLVEGLAHGCRVVTTSETGLADDLRDHPLVVLTPPGDPHALAEGLRQATRDTDPGPAPAREGHTKRDVTAWWLAAR